MCFDPASMALIGSAVSAGSSIMQGNAAAAAARYDAKVAGMNAKMINDRIMDERRQAADENRRVGQEAAGVIGAQIVGAGAANLDVQFGSPLRAILDSADAAARDAAHVMDNSSRTIRDLRQQQANYRSSANASRADAKGLRRGGYLQAGGTILGGIGDYGARRAKAEIR